MIFWTLNSKIGSNTLGNLYRPPSLFSDDLLTRMYTWYMASFTPHIHVESPGHHVDLDQVKILDREPRYFERGVKEAIYISVNKPSLNKDRGYPKCLTRFWSQVSKRSPSPNLGCQSPDEGRRIDQKIEVCGKFVLRS